MIGGLRIIAHRGVWEHASEQNSVPAFQRALSSGFGIETDLWWRDGEVLVSHDPPRGPGLALADLVHLYREMGSEAPLAFNAKSDALYSMDRCTLAPLEGTKYFFFEALRVFVWANLQRIQVRGSGGSVQVRIFKWR